MMTTKEIMMALQGVTDPEIPVVSIVDLGLVEDVRLEGERVLVDLLPTFAGCPALSIIRGEVEKALKAAGAPEAEVRFVLSPPWTTDRITPAGREALASFGIAAPSPEEVSCPYCGSQKTRRESSFGPTLCRQVYYCDACKNPFERMKPITLSPRAS